MKLDQVQILRRLNDVCLRVQAATSYGEFTASDYEARLLHTRCLAAIERFAPPDGAYRSALASIDESSSMGWRAKEAGAIVQALRDDYALGGLETVREILHADLFDDLLDIAGELQEKGFHAPAAVIAGSVLEEHLRKLADKSRIARQNEKGRPKGVDALSVELLKAGVLNDIQRRTVQLWYSQRNAAAHPGDPVPDSADVERMIDGVRSFVAGHPA